MTSPPRAASLDCRTGRQCSSPIPGAGRLSARPGSIPRSPRSSTSPRAPDAGEDYTALAAKFPTPPASAGLVKSGGFAQLSEDAFLRDFAGDIDPARARILYAVQGR